MHGSSYGQGQGQKGVEGDRNVLAMQTSDRTLQLAVHQVHEDALIPSQETSPEYLAHFFVSISIVVIRHFKVRLFCHFV